MVKSSKARLSSCKYMYEKIKSILMQVNHTCNTDAPFPTINTFLLLGDFAMSLLQCDMHITPFCGYSKVNCGIQGSLFTSCVLSIDEGLHG